MQSAMSKTETLYQLERPPFSSREFHTKFTSLAGPLSLFEPEDNADVGNENPEVERPLTPIEDAVKRPPSSFSALAKLVHPRLSPKEGIAGLSVNDQQQLIEILMSELNNIWRDVQRGPPDPFLDNKTESYKVIKTRVEVWENEKCCGNTSCRRLTIEIVVITQGLFAKYLEKANTLNQRGVFSGPANLSRLKTQLALEARKCFNVLSLRRNLATDMKNPLDARCRVSSRFSPSSRAIQAPSEKRYRPLVTRQEEDKKGKTNLSRAEKQQLWIDRELSDLERKMPRVEPSSLQTFLPHHLNFPTKASSDSGSVAEEKQSKGRLAWMRWKWKPIAPVKNILGYVSRVRQGFFMRSEDEAGFHFLHQKYASLPELFPKDVVLEELGVLPEEIQEYVMKRSQSETKLVGGNKFEVPEVDKARDPRPSTAHHSSQDLKKLLTPSTPAKTTERLQGEDENDDLPPLLQALARYSTTNKEKDHRKEKRLEKEDDAKDEQDDVASVTSTIQSTEASSLANDPTVMDENITEFTGEEHPQPAVVSFRLSDKSVVRTSDVRVSNRVNKASVTLKKYPTVYNDLTGEIDAPTVKWLDKNLFIGEEIKEVYEEIINTIGSDHLLFDQDTYVEKSVSTVDISLCTSSSSLHKPRTERIVNKYLEKDIPPPWGSTTADNWRNSPKFGGLGREDILQAKLKKGDDNGHGNKSYNSWLAWWRSTITTDDFLKFLSTQENDYMSLLFHLYDSDHEADSDEDGDEARPDTIQMALIRERERKLAELKLLKTDYKPGVWNVNSVLMGGLGNEPEVSEEELLANLEDVYSPVISATPSKQPTIAAVPSFAGSVGSAHSIRSNGSSNSFRQRMEEILKANSAAVTSQPTHTAGGVETATTSEAGSLSPQDRLERVWTLLCMPDAQRLDMAIKYSAEPYSASLLESLTFWEVATEVILERESLMTKLEDFERAASDPNRFFVKGSTGSSAERIRESKTRHWFDKHLSKIESDVRRAVSDVQRQFGDTVTFQGRPYLEKMGMDRTEMFYWLQQERRQQVMDKELVKMRELTLKTPPELPPIAAHTIL